MPGLNCENVITIAMFIFIIYLLMFKFDGFKSFKKTSNIFSGRPSIGALANKEGFSGDEDDKMNVSSSSYDPITMGAVKQSEVDAHYRNLEERSPFATVGTAGAKNVLRDDDEIYRNTGVKWVYRPPSRTFTTVLGGPQDGARQVGSVTEKDIFRQHNAGNGGSEFKW